MTIQLKSRGILIKNKLPSPIVIVWSSVYNIQELQHITKWNFLSMLTHQIRESKSLRFLIALIFKKGIFQIIFFYFIEKFEK